jgi:hypothetical protein
MGPFVNADWLGGASRPLGIEWWAARPISDLPRRFADLLERQFSHRLKIIVDDDHSAAVSNTFANIQRRNISPARTASFTASPILGARYPAGPGWSLEPI